jgi:hypothetical protein
MGGSIALAAAALALASCSAILDWSDYTGGDADPGATRSSASDGGTARDAAMNPSYEASEPENVDEAAAQAPPLDDAGVSSPCDAGACPKACDITVYFAPCCTPQGTCGCQSTIPTRGTCM